jgi:hypothetical protein
MSPDLDFRLQAARRFAALSGPFDPSHAIPTCADPIKLAMIATALAELCDTSPPGADGRWLMRAPERANVLRSLAMSDQIALAAVARGWLRPDVDGETASLLAAVLDQAPMDRFSIENVIDDPASRQELERVVLALDRAGEASPAADLLQVARSAVARWDADQREVEIASRPFYGRAGELKRLVAWIAKPTATPVRCIFVTGPPGIGKSALLDLAGHDAQIGSKRRLRLRLDFDRSGLDATDPAGLSLEAARQIGQQLGRQGVDLLEERLNFASDRDPTADAIAISEESGSASAFASRDLTRHVGAAVRRAGLSLIVTLDTLEILRGRGESHPAALFEWLDELARSSGPLVVIAAGRGDALDSVPTRQGESIELNGLDFREALSLLSDLGVQQRLRADLAIATEGSPLRLRLAAEIVKRCGELPKSRGGRVRALDEAYLYRFLLSRIDDPLLRRLAHPGLIVRRIDADVIRDVLAPQLRMGRMTIEVARELLRQLARHHWLVEPDPDAPGFYRHRADMRALLLPIVYSTAPVQSARIDETAAVWFGRRPEAWAEVESAYHRLQLMRTRPVEPQISWRVLSRIDFTAREELPASAQSLIRSATASRGVGFRTGSAAVDDEELYEELLGVVARMDWREGAFLVEQAMRTGGIDARTRAGDAMRTVLWRSGQWQAARRSLIERDRLDDRDEDLADVPLQFALVRLEMRAEFQPAALRRDGSVHELLGKESFGRSATGGADNVARHGALALQMLSIDRALPFVRLGTGDADVAQAIVQCWSGDDGNAEVLAAMAVGEKRLSQMSVQMSETGRAMATLTPYAVIAMNLAADGKREGIVIHAQAVLDRLLATDGLVGELSAAPRPGTRTHPITALSEAGLFAEWAGVAGGLLRDRDLTLIGRAAERWRRAACGNWPYMGMPRLWRDQGRPDQVLVGRLDNLLRSKDPVKRAFEQIAIWGSARMVGVTELAGEGSASYARLRKRFEGSLAKAADQRRSRSELSTLLIAGVPAAYAVPLAALIILGID